MIVKHMQVEVSLRHFKQLMGSYGLYQHADTYQPLLSEGYCTDDNARAVQVLVRLMPFLSDDQQVEAERFLATCWRFVREARVEPGSYVNFRDADGQWRPRKPESEDMYARIVRCLAEVMVNDKNTGRREEARQMSNDLAARVEQFTAPRAWAEVLIALGVMASTGQAPQYVIDLRKKGDQFLTALWQKNSSLAWPWFEQTMTYANALFPHALLLMVVNSSRSPLPPDKAAHLGESPPANLDPMVGLRQGRGDKGGFNSQLSNTARGRTFSELFDILEASADFLITSTVRNKIFIPIGSEGWYPAGGSISQENQQPIEAGLMFDFLLGYRRAFPERVTMETLAAPYLWFFGHNTGQVVMADINDGASFDGIFASGPNTHRGAESMLAYLWCEVRLAEAEEEVKKFIEKQTGYA